MIDRAMTFLTKGLDQALRRGENRGREMARMGAPSRKDDAPKSHLNCVMVTLVNLERENVARNTAQTVQNGPDGPMRTTQPLNLNLVFMLSANYPDAYSKSLGAISAAAAYFQANPVFTRQTAPELPKELTRLSVEWRDIDLQGMHNLWTVLGGDYVPSALFTARMLVIQNVDTAPDAAQIKGVEVDL